MESAGLKGSMEELAISFLFLFLFYFCHRACRIRGEGNGNPLQYSCLENPRDRGAEWAAVYGVAQSWTRLKQLSSSSSSMQDPSSSIQDPTHTSSL